MRLKIIRSYDGEGCYEVAERISEKHGRHLWLPQVQGRDLILLHGANNAARDLRGCIAPVFLLSGIGCGENSQLALVPLCSIVIATLKQKEPVTLKIISMKTQWSHQFSIMI
jgi:hypothetical protein